MEDKDIPGLLYKYLQGTLQEDEQRRLEDWKARSPDNASLMEEIASPESLSESLSEYHPDNKKALRERILHKILDSDHQFSHAPERPVMTGRRWWMAAAVLAAVVSSVYFIASYYQRPEPGNVAVSATPAEVLPGKTGAILTLSDGSQVVLDSLREGVVSNQNGTQVVLEDGGLAYNPAGPASGGITYNTITTPKGRQFDVRLPDGTRAWLNAASTITYPTAFHGNERMVKITGEVYLEVVKSNVPFMVNVNNKTSIRVLGTHFNVNAYDNEESISTTLLEGSVRIASIPAGSRPSDRETVILRPGQQAKVQVGSGGHPEITVSSDVSVEKVVAWKNGLFDFEGATLGEVMRQLERWYDIEVVYEGDIQQLKLTGKMTRGVTLNGLLKGLDRLGIHCQLEGRTLKLFP
ncbi:FecR family protein [Chitinophaga cymbidii]|uniref:Iron dicitrate transporter FecR n=1 Tax=Chitinophaga cymbidii TaxID=1096750 RepID=A0A512RG72_9BACT|nr:FecR domain-containing protein [Chitinophaga cymbidii]GEP94690.1 iron dicitrate transporter FecR [Chitinophaga cymbidii]